MMSINLIKNRLSYRKLGSKIFKTWQCRTIQCGRSILEKAEMKVSDSLEGKNESLYTNSVFKNEDEVQVIFSDKKVMKIGTGKLAKLSDGCATVTFGDTTVMATVVSKSKSNGESFLPLVVSYQQKAAALGRIPLNFRRREIGQSEYEILTSRVIDRSVRPLFPLGFNWDIQIVCNPLALDGSNFPDVLSINAASAALTLSDVPWNGPVAAVRVGLIDGEAIINPSKLELSKSSLNLIVTSRENKLVVMLEGSASNILLQDLLKVVKQGVKECGLILQAMVELKKKFGKKKREFEAANINPKLKEMIETNSSSKLKEIFSDHSHHKLSRDQAISELQKDVLAKAQDDFNKEDMEMASEIFHSVCKTEFRKQILETDIRCDGRKLNELRNIQCEVGLFKPLHGSALFQRGQTQVMCTVSLDSPASALKTDKIDTITSGLKEKNFFVHYEFPPFATKEIGKLGVVGRREMGHGALAEKALKANVPENFPFTIRLTSEVLESNGSSSMATVCGGSLALMDAGVPLETACAGVAMGLVTTSDDQNPFQITQYKILTDILGIEDHFGDMDFKLAGTKKAITAVQMDIKNSGITIGILSEILIQGKNAISNILKVMNAVCDRPRLKKNNWPLIQTVKVPLHLRSKFLGPGGVNLKQLEVTAGVEFSEESPGDFTIFAPNQEAMDEVNEVIPKLLEQVQEPVLEFGGVYKATIVEIREHGCMVTLHPDMQPIMIHVSQLDHKKVSHPSALGLKEGEEIQVKYFGRDPVSGTMRLSRKVLQGITTHSPQFVAKKEVSETLPNVS